MNELGKIPPNSIETEEVILGAILLEPALIHAVGSILFAEAFYNEAHSKVYNAIVHLKNTSRSIDMVTVTHELKRTKDLEVVGGAAFISKLTQRVGTTASIEDWCRIIVNHYAKRELIRCSMELGQMGYNEFLYTEDIMGWLQKKMEDIGSMMGGNSIQTPKQFLKEMVEDVAERMKDNNVKSLPSSIHLVQKRLNGYYQEELIILGGRPGSGKTAFMLSEIYHWANAGYPVGIFSLEMSKAQLMFRIASFVTGIDVLLLSKKKLSEEEFIKLNNCLGALERMPIYIDDTPSADIQDIRSKARLMKNKYKCRLIAVDYLQLVTASSKSGNREQEIGLISRTLKLIAKENHIPVMALSQMSRDVDKRGGNGKPKLSDLRESGSIEQDADVVAFTWRPHEYDKTIDEGIGYLVVAKNRNGGLGDAIMRWVKEKTLYTNYTKEIDNHYEPKGPSENEPF
jgi:replicative DNA helicase